MNILPTVIPINTAVPPRRNIFIACLRELIFRNLALINPREKRLVKDTAIEIRSAFDGLKTRYGMSGMNPEKKYARSIIIAPCTELF